MGIFRRVVTAGRRVTGFLLGPVRETIHTTPGTRREAVAVEQSIGDAAAPWWFAVFRKLWVFLLSTGLMYLDQRNGWQLAGSEVESRVGEAVWLVVGGWLTYRAANRVA
ncbi:MAG: hypothetical protein KIS96_11755 [Bauldia sp.]|nr:hypothetical protein [Bauldia sp.]